MLNFVSEICIEDIDSERQFLWYIHRWWLSDDVITYWSWEYSLEMSKSLNVIYCENNTFNIRELDILGKMLNTKLRLVD